MITHIVKRFLVLAVALGTAASASGQGAASTRAVGPITAKVTVDVYSDFQCPSCKALAEQTLPRLTEEYAKKNKIRLVHHDFPLSMHAHAREAALLAAAADRVGKFDAVSQALFQKQDAWAATGRVEEVVDSVLTPAEARKVHELVNDPAIAAQVQRDIDLGKRLNVTATPTLIVTKNLKSDRVAGFVSYPILARFLDQQLAQ